MMLQLLLPEHNENKILVFTWVIVSLAGWAVPWSPFIGRDNWLLDALSPTTWPVLPQLVAMKAILFAMLTAIIVALGQWMCLLARWTIAARWFRATFLGITVGWSIGLLLHFGVLAAFRQALNWGYGAEVSREVVTVVASLSAAIVAGFVGLAVGTCQWWVLRNRVSDAWRWIVRSAAAWAIGGAMYWLLYAAVGGPFCQAWNCEDRPIEAGYFEAATIGWLASGVVVGLITKYALKLLLDDASRIHAVSQGVDR